MKSTKRFKTEVHVMPGDKVELIGDLVHNGEMEKSSRFTLCESETTVGTSIVSELYKRKAGNRLMLHSFVY
ncbi:unnamed protein product [Rhizoctonia solani]|uniref:Uncharacterized protein n=1 Tax=Rhizoctonia solani TaxID=456999 RepID=A0A8H3DDL0_9AGAM|nr:unnamed protein product [Rhizoctonia solani]